MLLADKGKKEQMKRIVILFACCISTAIYAQDVSFYITGTEIVGGWKEIIKCADRPYPMIAGKERLEQEIWYQNIYMCRIMTIARHAGWVDAGRLPESDPFPPVPLNREGDFKTELKCDYSGLDSRGIGLVKCEYAK